MADIQQWYGTGRRKEATARVFLRPGSGEIRINRRSIDDYFHRESLRIQLLAPLELTQRRDSLDVVATVAGGGMTGQAGAIRLGIARALLQHDPSLRSDLKAAGLLTRDARRVERKKYGQPGARKRFQFSKR